LFARFAKGSPHRRSTQGFLWEGKMLVRKYCGIPILLALFSLILLPAGQAEGQQSAAKDSAKLQVYVVPFSHLDLFWAGTREECLTRGNRIIARSIQISEQHPEFKFFIESNNFLANFVETHTGTRELEELKRLVKEGRIEISPNWADIFQNMPDGEVETRNLVYGKEYARTVFGVNPQIIHPGDIPGFISQYPQMLKEADIPFMVMSRMGPPDKALFDWSSPDGSKVLVWNELHGYGWGVHLGFHHDWTEQDTDRLRTELEEAHRISPGPIYIPWGVDLWGPTDKLVTNVDALNGDFPSAHFILATPQDFFKALDRQKHLADLSGEVPMSWPHVIDSIVHLWQYSVPATNTLTTAETFATINYALGYAKYPQQEFEVLWKNLIESMDHNHDGQGGLIGDNRKKEYSKLAIIRGGEILRDMQRNIAERVKIPIPNSYPIVVFNSLGWQRDGLVKAHVSLYGDVQPSDLGDFRKGLRLVDETGKTIPFYVEQTTDVISRSVELIFVAQGVPSLGYRTYYLTSAEQPESFPTSSDVQLDSDKDLKRPQRPLGEDVMENQFYKVTVDKATGGVTVFDKGLNREVSKDMRIVGFEERGTNNIQPESDTGLTFPMSVNGTDLEENNGVRTVLKILGSIADIPIVQRLVLYRNLKRLDITNSLDWKEPRYIRIEQLFPVQQPGAQMEYGVPFGANSFDNVMPGTGPHARDEIQREAWQKYRVIQGWVFAGTPEWGLTVAADHQLMRLESGLIQANMIRGQRYTSARINHGGELTSMRYPAKGHYVFRYSLSSGPGDWKSVRSYQAGLGFNNPLIPVSVVDDVSAKSLPPTYSFCSVQGENLVISALKKSESSGDVILRLYEIQGEKADTPVSFLGKQKQFQEVNLLEEPLQSSEERTLRVNPYEIKTLSLQLKAQTASKRPD
jgi:alpha-mannosidase